MRYFSKKGAAYTLNDEHHVPEQLVSLGFIEMREDWPGKPYVAREDGTWSIDEQAAFEMLRNERDKRLAACDYRALPDFPQTDEQKERVLTYRQALRDLPAMVGAPWDGGGPLTPWPELT